MRLRGFFWAVAAVVGFLSVGTASAQIITCESQNLRRQYCPINDPRSQVDLVKVLSQSPCVRGQTWGNDGRGIWVDRGCRARFRVTVYGGGNTPPPWWNSGGRPPQRPRDGACFFRHYNYAGDYFCRERGSRVNTPNGFENEVSSIQIYGRATVTFFSYPNFGGMQSTTRHSVSDLRRFPIPKGVGDWNDRISSVIVD
jgi:Protein of unknown function (DUF3011)/Peptidase inhibitor family I36